jgi:hypothetical protein
VFISLFQWQIDDLQETLPADIPLSRRDNKEEIEKALITLFSTSDTDKTAFLKASALIKNLGSDWELGKFSSDLRNANEC